MKAPALYPEYYKDGQLPLFQVSYLITEDYGKTHTRLPHVHEDMLELLYIYNGKGKYIAAGTEYDVQTGDVVINNAGTLHGEVMDDSSRQMRTYSIHMTNIKLQDMQENCLCGSGETPVVPMGLLAEQVGELFRLTYTLSGDDSLWSVCCSLSSCILQLVWELLTRRTRNDAQRRRTSAADTAERIRSYLDTHFRQDISLASVGRALRINEYYLSHVFKNEYNISPMQYVARRRIGEAQTLLTDTEFTIAEISDHLGFCSVCHFSTTFRKYAGTTPARFRRNMHNMEDSAAEN